jgi:hypothetical protein
MRPTVPRRLCSLVLALALLPVSPGHAEGQNLLRNPSFEEGWYHASMSNFIPNGWSYWFQHRAPDEPRLHWMPEPEFGGIEDRPGQATSGRWSARWFNIWAIHNAGLYQRVAVPRGARLRFAIWVLSWSSQNDQWLVSESWQHRWVGIDPTGGTDPFSPSIVWGRDDATMDQWVRLSIEATALAESATVFVREQPDWPVKHNDCLVDDAELVVLAPPETAPSPVDAGRPDAAPDATTGEVSGTLAAEHSYVRFISPGFGRLHTVNVQVSSLDGVGFRVYGPTAGRVYAHGGAQSGLVPNLSADVVADQAGEYLVQLHQVAPARPIAYRVWITS